MKSCPCDQFIKHHAMKWGSGGTAPSFLTSAQDGGEWSASRPCHFTSRETAHGTHNMYIYAYKIYMYVRIYIEYAQMQAVSSNGYNCKHGNYEQNVHHATLVL
jgi:hypothetical protein